MKKLTVLLAVVFAVSLVYSFSVEASDDLEIGPEGFSFSKIEFSEEEEGLSFSEVLPDSSLDVFNGKVLYNELKQLPVLPLQPPKTMLYKKDTPSCHITIHRKFDSNSINISPEEAKRLKELKELMGFMKKRLETLKEDTPSFHKNILRKLDSNSIDISPEEAKIFKELMNFMKKRLETLEEDTPSFHITILRKLDSNLEKIDSSPEELKSLIEKILNK